MIKKIFIYIRLVKYYLVGNIAILFIYEKKYVDSNEFKGIRAKGWKWIYTDIKARIFRGIHKGIPFPISPNVKIGNYENIEFSNSSIHCFQTADGAYFQGYGGKIILGENVWIAPNVGIINSNHDFLDPSVRLTGRDVVIKNNSWIGMNSVILPGIVLGENTIVGAGSVVTKSFPDGYCVIAGNPAKIIKLLDNE